LATLAAATSDAYKQQSILTAPPGRLVVMLYDGCIRFLFQSAYAMRQGDRKTALQRVRKAEAIIDELRVTLDRDKGGEIATNLDALYGFSRSHLLKAWTEQDAEKIDDVSRLMGELRDAWAQIAASEAVTSPRRTGFALAATGEAG
jgi:flagellar protein FliS